MYLKRAVSMPVIFSVLYMYFRHSNIISNSVKDALYICYDTLIPSLFVFMVISTVIADTKFSEYICIPFIPFFRLLKITDKKIMTYCIWGLLGGFASGGYFLNRILQEYSIDENLTKILTIITSLNSPAFIISVVGEKMTGNIYIGIMIYASVVLSAYITAFISSFFINYSAVQRIKKGWVNNFSAAQSIYKSVTGMLNICGVFIISHTICNVIHLYTQNSLILWFFSAFTEVTSSCFFVHNDLGNNIYLYCATLCIFPLSAALQIKSFSAGNIYSFRFLCFSKLIQIPIALCFLKILVNVFPVISSVYSSNDISVSNYWHSPQLSIYLFIISIIFVVMFDKKVGVFTKKPE